MSYFVKIKPHLKKIQKYFKNNDQTYSLEQIFEWRQLTLGDPETNIIESIELLPKLKNLTLSCTGLKQGNTLSFKSDSIKDLRINYTQIEVESLELDCPNLKNLVVEETRISKVNLTKLPRLIDLIFDSSELTSVDLSHNPYIYRANVSGNHLKEIIINNRHLRELQIDSNQIKEFHLEESQCPKLQTLLLEENAFKTFSLEHSRIKEISLFLQPRIKKNIVKPTLA